ncbi:cuticle protein AM1159-like [Cherax quadricarinatus]|uniref:cuticle protein AM1159-like n=1 Tax=Cherax quadricarinatus TaxID=27406 RepID=UPI0023795429|nr:cuticle protein AM1159-like [Cherax quadricarinatus]
MKLVILACLAAVAVAAPQLQDNQPVVVILRDDRQDNGDGNFNYAFEADNGIIAEASGSPGSQGQSNIQGVYRLTFPEGGVAEVRYIADENGFRPESEILPTAHPLPAHAQEQLRIAEEQRAQGIEFDQRGFRVNRK